MEQTKTPGFAVSNGMGRFSGFDFAFEKLDQTLFKICVQFDKGKAVVNWEHIHNIRDRDDYDGPTLKDRVWDYLTHLDVLSRKCEGNYTLHDEDDSGICLNPKRHQGILYLLQKNLQKGIVMLFIRILSILLV